MGGGTGAAREAIGLVYNRRNMERQKEDNMFPFKESGYFNQSSILILLCMLVFMLLIYEHCWNGI